MKVNRNEMKRTEAASFCNFFLYIGLDPPSRAHNLFEHSSLENVRSTAFLYTVAFTLSLAPDRECCCLLDRKSVV